MSFILIRIDINMPRKAKITVVAPLQQYDKRDQTLFTYNNEIQFYFNLKFIIDMPQEQFLSFFFKVLYDHMSSIIALI